MSRSYQRPENALKRAQEFIDVAKPTKALDVLYEVIKKSKMRANYSEKVLQPIMHKFVELCVDQKKSHYAKEGLYQFRNIFQNVNVMALENAVRLLLQLADERTETARLESHQAVVDVEDLDCPRTSEEIILSAVSGEDAQDRSDRTILTPWVKFLWEVYRHCLDLLRINSKVERLYHDIAKHAFKFCEKYGRKTEFRKLCENLRNHLLNIQKQQGGSTTAVNLNNPETQQLNLETRLEQLNYAIKMELWQEAYKAIEDISDLMMKSKKMPKPHVMASYYQKLALVFWKAGNLLFHAAALFKLFQLLRDQKKNITQEELSKRASTVLVATLAIPLPSAHPEFDRFIETEKSALEKIDKLAFLLNISKPPTRVSLIRDLNRFNIISHVHPELQNMYNLMETDFDPLNLCKRMQGYFNWINERPESGLPQYVKPLQDMTTCRLIKQVSQIYQTIQFDRLHTLAVFVTPFHLERVLVDLVRHNDLQIRIDHRSRCIHFGMDLSESQREDLAEGPSLQILPSETIRTQLVQMSSLVKRCIAMIYSDNKAKEMEPIRAQTIQMYQQTRRNEHQRLLQRQHIIEERKELLETQNLEREELQRRQMEEQQKRQKEEEQERLRREASKREKERHEEQMKQIQTKQIKEKLIQISKTTYGAKMIEKIDKEELLLLGPEEILQRQVEELEKERKEHQKKLKAQEKLIDHFERAKRLIEIPKLKKFFDKQKEEDKIFWQTQEKDRVKKMVEEHELAYKNSIRLSIMIVDKDIFVERLKSQRRSEIEKKLNDFNAKFEEERKNRLSERKEARKKERRDAYYRQKAEEEQQRKDEELKKQREEEEMLEQERMQREEEEGANRRIEQENLRNVTEARTEDAKSAPWRAKKVTASRVKEQEKMDAWRVKDDDTDGDIRRDNETNDSRRDRYRDTESDVRRDKYRDTEAWRSKDNEERTDNTSRFVSRDVRRDDAREEYSRDNRREEPRDDFRRDDRRGWDRFREQRDDGSNKDSWRSGGNQRDQEMDKDGDIRRGDDRHSDRRDTEWRAVNRNKPSWRARDEVDSRDEKNKIGNDESWRSFPRRDNRDVKKNEDGRRDDDGRRDNRRDDDGRRDNRRDDDGRRDNRRDDDVRRENPRNDDVRRENPRNDDVRRENTGNDDARRENLRNDDARRENPRNDDVRRENPRNDDVRRENPRNDDVCRENPRNDDVRRENPRNDEGRHDEKDTPPVKSAWRGNREDKDTVKESRKQPQETDGWTTVRH